MTWNVWGRFGPWQEREAALIRTLETLAPDVVTLQECWRDRSGQDQAAHLARALGYHSAYGGGTFLAEDWATGSALQSRWPIEHHEHREFPASAPERWGGSALFGRIAGSGSWGGQRPKSGCGSGSWGGQRPKSGTLCHEGGTHGRSDRCRRSFRLPILQRSNAY